MTQAEAVIETISKLGGVATLDQINKSIFDVIDCEWNTNTPFASIRRIVRHTNGIYVVKRGVYALEDYRTKLEQQGIVVQTEHNAESEEVKLFNHSYYQGLLLEMGRMRHFDTFVPDQDKKKLFITTPLNDLRTVKVLPPYSYPNIVKRSSTIDVIWLNERNMPDSFFEIEHTTDIQNSLLKYNDLQDFYVRMVIVAEEKRRPEFESKINYSAFSNLKKNNRVKFLSYDSLDNQYEIESKKQKYDFII